MENADRYFLAIIPPAPVLQRIETIKHELANQFGCKASLRSPAHLTLHMPFFWKIGKHERLINTLVAFSRTKKPFQLNLKGFGCFEPRVLFINVDSSSELFEFQYSLKRFCRKELNLLNAEYQDLPFHPHITIAFRDLKKEVFYQAWKEIRDHHLDESFVCDSLALLQHDGSRWKEHMTMILGG